MSEMKGKKLSQLLDLELAWRRIKSDTYNDIIPDILKYKDVEYDKKTTIKNIKRKLDEGYEPSELLMIDMPKKGYTLRPGSNMVPEDRIVYQAIIDYISKRVEEPPADCVFSFRLNKDTHSNSLFKYWRHLWLEWRRKMREVYEDGYRYLLRTDIAAYFEHINHSILRSNIFNGQVEDQHVLDLLEGILKKWAVSEAPNIGIPQGCDASSFIGNLYLINLDKIMKRELFKYFRYSDGIYILAQDEKELRMAIKVLIHELRNLHLNLQDAKTEILTDYKTVKKEIGSGKDDKTKDFDYEFQRKLESEELEESKEEILKEYKKITGNGKARKIDISNFTWCINKFRKLRCDKAVNFTLKRLAEMPFLADTFFKYLKIFANRKCVKKGIVQFLTSSDNIYEWQEMWLLFTLSKADRLDDSQLQVVREIIGNNYKHWASRAVAIIVLGKLGDNADRLRLKRLYANENNNYIKRAIAVSVHSLPKAARNRFYAKIEKESYDMNRLVKYLKQERIETI